MGCVSDDDCQLHWISELLDAGLIAWNAEMLGAEVTDNSMICAKRSNGQGICNGDSGGPLVIKGGNGADDIQVGVASFASISGCATDSPDIYSRVSHAYGWIRSEVCKMSTYAIEASFDTPNWVDAIGNECKWYEAYDSPGCPIYGWTGYGTLTGTAKENCCYCMADSLVSLPTNPPVSSPANPPCIDTPNWVDFYGDGCEWYETSDSPGCPEYGDIGASYADAGTAKENCCYCMTS